MWVLRPTTILRTDMFRRTSLMTSILNNTTLQDTIRELNRVVLGTSRYQQLRLSILKTRIHFRRSRAVLMLWEDWVQDSDGRPFPYSAQNRQALEKVQGFDHQDLLDHLLRHLQLQAQLRARLEADLYQLLLHLLNCALSVAIQQPVSTTEYAPVKAAKVSSSERCKKAPNMYALPIKHAPSTRGGETVANSADSKSVSPSEWWKRSYALTPSRVEEEDYLLSPNHHRNHLRVLPYRSSLHSYGPTWTLLQIWQAWTTRTTKSLVQWSRLSRKQTKPNSSIACWRPPWTWSNISPKSFPDSRTFAPRTRNCCSNQHLWSYSCCGCRTVPNTTTPKWRSAMESLWINDNVNDHSATGCIPSWNSAVTSIPWKSTFLRLLAFAPSHLSQVRNLILPLNFHQYILNWNQFQYKKNIQLLTFDFSHYSRSPWSERAPQGWATSNENNRLVARPRHIQCWSSAKVPLLQWTPRKASRTTISFGARIAANILSKTRRFGTGAAIHRKYVCCQSTILSNRYIYYKI